MAYKIIADGEVKKVWVQLSVAYWISYYKEQGYTDVRAERMA